MSHQMLSLTSVTSGTCLLSVVMTEERSHFRVEHTKLTSMPVSTFKNASGAEFHDENGNSLVVCSAWEIMKNGSRGRSTSNRNWRAQLAIPISSLIVGIPTSFIIKAVRQALPKSMEFHTLTISFLVSLVVPLVANTPPQV